MNGLHKLRKEFSVSGIVDFEILLYMALISNVSSGKVEGDDTVYALCSCKRDDLYDIFATWDESEIDKAVDALLHKGLIFMDTEGGIYAGEIRGSRFFPFNAESSIADAAIEKLREAIKSFEKPRSALRRSRGRFIAEQINTYIDRGISEMTPGDFTTLFTYLYEIFTGGETYMVRNKTEYYQTTNILKAYDKFTTFAILVEGTLNYPAYARRGVPTLTRVSVMKDTIFGALSRGDGSKDYMREVDDEREGF